MQATKEMLCSKIDSNAQSRLASLTQNERMGLAGAFIPQHEHQESITPEEANECYNFFGMPCCVFKYQEVCEVVADPLYYLSHACIVTNVDVTECPTEASMPVPPQRSHAQAGSLSSILR